MSGTYIIMINWSKTLEVVHHFITTTLRVSIYIHTYIHTYIYLIKHVNKVGNYKADVDLLTKN